MIYHIRYKVFNGRFTLGVKDDDVLRKKKDLFNRIRVGCLWIERVQNLEPLSLLSW